MKAVFVLVAVFAMIAFAQSVSALGSEYGTGLGYGLGVKNGDRALGYESYGLGLKNVGLVSTMVLPSQLPSPMAMVSKLFTFFLWFSRSQVQN